MLSPSMQSKNKALISGEKELRKLNIRYTIQNDGTLLVQGPINLTGQGLIELPDLSNVIIHGSFYCSNNKLTSLKGCPKRISGTFICQGNNITNLKGGPQFVGGDYDCYTNKLTSLEGAPKSCPGSFNCYNNQLESVGHSPEFVGENFFCHDNRIKHLKGSPKIVNGDIDCSDNRLTTLEGLPEQCQTVYSDLGDFETRESIPVDMLISLKEKVRLQNQRKRQTKEIFNQQIQNKMKPQETIKIKKTLQVKKKKRPKL